MQISLALPPSPGDLLNKSNVYFITGLEVLWIKDHCCYRSTLSIDLAKLGLVPR